MGYTREFALCLGVGLAACDQQATEQYLGEPLLQLHGNATIAVETGGEPVKPALCFTARNPNRVPDTFDQLPAEARAELDSTMLSRDQRNELADKALLWARWGKMEIVEVDAVGHFPAEFRIAAYLPPSDDFVKPLFEGEPAMAEGHLCAVREEHPDVVHQPTLLSSYVLPTTQEDTGPQTLYMAWLDGDIDSYYLETWHCPSADSPQSECTSTAEGDVSVQRNAYGTFVEAEAEPTLLYLAEPAAPDSYTAWKYGAPEGLAAGFHLFTGPSRWESFLGHSQSDNPDCQLAGARASTEVQAKYPDRVEYTQVGEITLSNIPSDPFLYNEVQRRTAELTMQHCEPIAYEPLSMQQSIAIKFRGDQQRLPLPGHGELPPPTP